MLSFKSKEYYIEKRPRGVSQDEIMGILAYLELVALKNVSKKLELKGIELPVFEKEN